MNKNIRSIFLIIVLMNNKTECTKRDVSYNSHLKTYEKLQKGIRDYEAFIYCTGNSIWVFSARPPCVSWWGYRDIYFPRDAMINAKPLILAPKILPCILKQEHFCINCIMYQRSYTCISVLTFIRFLQICTVVS